MLLYTTGVHCTLYIEAVGNKHFKTENQNSIDVLVFIYSAIIHSRNFASKNYFILKKNNIDLTKLIFLRSLKKRYFLLEWVVVFFKLTNIKIK